MNAGDDMVASYTVASHGDIGPDGSAVPDATIVALLARACHGDPERPLILTEDGLRLTRGEFLARCERLAGHLATRISPGDRVAVMLDNRVEFLIALFAIVACRGALVSIAPTAKSHDAGNILADSAPVLLIHGPPQQGVADEITLGNMPTICITAPEPDGFAHLDTAPADFRKAGCRREDIVAVYYTSGSTGAPKGCMLHHGWWLRIADIDLRLFPRGWQDRQLCVLPFYYADPALQLLTALASGGTLVVMRRFSVSRFWEVVRRFDATEVLSIASIPALLMTAGPHPAERDHRIRRAIHAGLPPDIHRQLVDRYGFDWLNQYGSTEGGIMARVPDALADTLIGSGTVGVEPPGVRIRLVDEAGKDAPTGEAGEALVSGPDLFAGYLNRPEATAEAMQDGWYHTGDLLRRDARGLLYFVGRKKDIIRRSGENIAAAEVEAVLAAHPAIVEAAVIPVPDRLRGEEVLACLLLQPDDPAPAMETVIAHCAGRLAGFKLPRYLVIWQGEFPRLPSMKVDKQVLKAGMDDLLALAWDREAR